MQALLAESTRLVLDGLLRHDEDIFYLTLHELYDVVRTNRGDYRLIRERMDAFRPFSTRSMPS